MANIDIPWEVDGMMTPEQSVSAMFPVIQSKKIQHSGTFWTWENKVCKHRLASPNSGYLLTLSIAVPLVGALSAPDGESVIVMMVQSLAVVQ